MTASLAHRPRGSAQWWGLGIFVLAVILTAVIGSVAVTGTAEEYQTLQQPRWAPPSWLFGPVWTVLYAMIAASGWLVWRKTGVGKEIAAYAAQLVLNAVWTPLFFGAGRYGLAFADIVVMWILIGVTFVLFWRVSRPAAWMLLPYWAWVTFASALNFSIWQLNS